MRSSAPSVLTANTIELGVAQLNFDLPKDETEMDFSHFADGWRHVRIVELGIGDARMAAVHPAHAGHIGRRDYPTDDPYLRCLPVLARPGLEDHGRRNPSLVDCGDQRQVHHHLGPLDRYFHFLMACRKETVGNGVTLGEKANKPPAPRLHPSIPLANGIEIGIIHL